MCISSVCKKRKMFVTDWTVLSQCFLLICCSFYYISFFFFKRETQECLSARRGDKYFTAAEWNASIFVWRVVSRAPRLRLGVASSWQPVTLKRSPAAVPRRRSLPRSLSQFGLPPWVFHHPRPTPCKPTDAKCLWAFVSVRVSWGGRPQLWPPADTPGWFVFPVCRRPAEARLRKSCRDKIIVCDGPLETHNPDYWVLADSIFFCFWTPSSRRN